jgi:uncharacterized membrane protein
MEQSFSIKESFRFAWNTFTTRPWLLIGLVLAFAIASQIVSLLIDDRIENGGAFGFALGLVMFVIGCAVEMMIVAFWLQAHDHIQDINFKALWQPAKIVPYIFTKIVQAVVVIAGLILLIVPGVIFALMFLFANYLVVDRGMKPIEAMKESKRITSGKKWKLLGFVLLIALLNIAGAIAFVVGLLVTIPITYLAMVHVYRTLAHKAQEVATPAVSPAPAA